MDSKSIASMIVDRGNGSLEDAPPGLGPEEGSDEIDEGVQAAAEDVMSALESKDAMAFARALKTFLAVS